MHSALWIVVSFLAGSIPFSYLLGRWMLRRDIRHYGDGNPGATNLLRAGNKRVAVAGLILDFTKGTIPVGWAYHFAHRPPSTMLLIALAPIVGHAISPWVRFRGGKAVAVTGGVWCGLTAWEGPTVGGVLLGIATRIVGANGWAVITSFVGMLAYLVLTPRSWNQMVSRPSKLICVMIGLANLAILAWKHADDLCKHPIQGTRNIRA